MHEYGTQKRVPNTGSGRTLTVPEPKTKHFMRFLFSSPKVRPDPLRLPFVTIDTVPLNKRSKSMKIALKLGLTEHSHYRGE